MKTIIKRDGKKDDFIKDKISNAILKAYKDKYGDNKKEYEKIANKIANNIYSMKKDIMTVEEVQDIVIRELMDYDKDVAICYNNYREERTKVRESKTTLVKNVSKRINASNVENSNANVDENSFSGREKEASADVQKYIALELGVLSKEVSDAHKNMECYQHDLEKTPIGEHNCLNADMKKLLQGFKTRNGDVRKANRFSTACQLYAVIFQCQSQVQFGGVGSVHIDYDLAPYVKISFYKLYKKNAKRVLFFYTKNMKKKLFNKLNPEMSVTEYPKYGIYRIIYKYAMEDLINEGKQSCQALYHNLNTLESRQGSQVPFTSINFGRDTSYEGRLVSEWLMYASLDGIGEHHRTSIFPISIFQYKQGVNANPGDPNYNIKLKAIESLSKRIYPNMVNGDFSEAHEDPSNPDTFMSTMGCRTMTGFDRHGMGYIRVGRGNNVPITMILPKIGIDFGICLGKRETPDIEGFWKELDRYLKITEKGLLERYEIMKAQSPKSAPFMYENGTISNSDKCKDSVEESLKHNSLAIGYIGINEMLYAMFGTNHVHSSEARKFALKVVQRINEFAKEASEINDLNFVCYATPAEGLCGKAASALKNMYGVIPNVTDRDYITNSHHVPVWEKISIYDKLRIEAPFCKYATGGCITYIELDSTFIHNTRAIENIIDYAFKELNIPYLAFNFPIDTCLECGYQGEFNDCCPVCGSNHYESLRRVTGYLSTDYRNFNKGKIAEVLDRAVHSKYTSVSELFVKKKVR